MVSLLVAPPVIFTWLCDRAHSRIIRAIWSVVVWPIAFIDRLVSRH